MPPETGSDGEVTVDTIIDCDVWDSIANGLQAINRFETVFEFTPDGFENRSVDAANVAMVRQTVDADDFDHYDVSGTFRLGVNIERFGDVIGKVDAPVHLWYDWDNYEFVIEAGEIEFRMAGLTVDSVTGSPFDVPPADKDGYVVDCTVPTDKFDRAVDVTDMVTNYCTFTFDDDSAFTVTGDGDTDSVSVDIHDADDFAYNDDGTPDTRVTVKQSLSYLQDFVSIIDADTFRMVTGDNMPYHVWTTRHDTIDTKIMQAPRLPKSA